jgi:hypothetical protein
MTEDLRPITTKNLSDAIRLLNESSRDTSLQYNVDFFGFLAIRQFWNFSLGYSLIRYIDGLPAAIAINCADPQTHEAYNFYWGALPQFRSPKISIRLFDAFCQTLHDDGYTMLYGTAIPDRPVSRYRFIHAYPLHPLVDMKSDCSGLPAADPAFSIRKIDVSTLSQVPSLATEPFHWSQRPSFLANIHFYVDLLGAFAGNDLKAYAVVPAKPKETTLFDLRSPAACRPAGYELLRYVAQNYPSPVLAQHVLEGSFAERLLADAGFVVLRRYSSLYRDLRTTCARRDAS